jgi:hypothetical protein
MNKEAFMKALRQHRFKDVHGVPGAIWKLNFNWADEADLTLNGEAVGSVRWRDACPVFDPAITTNDASHTVHDNLDQWASHAYNRRLIRTS